MTYFEQEYVCDYLLAIITMGLSVSNIMKFAGFRTPPVPTPPLRVVILSEFCNTVSVKKTTMMGLRADEKV